jgi:ketosteroid isomerase-like protein
VQAGGRLVIAIDGKTVRDAKGKDGKAPHLVAVAVVVIRKKTSRYRVARSATNISGVSHRTLVV